MAIYIQFKSKNGQETVFSGPNKDGEFKSILGPLSSYILQAITEKNVVIIFSQGKLNLTPLITSLFLESESKGDIVIGIPRAEYQDLNIQYYQNFFSLLRGNNQFFYKNTLWCSSNRKTDTEFDDRITFGLDNIKFRPRWGMKSYKKDVEHSLNQEIQTGEINNRRFIITFPLTKGITGLNLGNIKFSFENQNLNLRKVFPKLVVLESLNSTMNRIDSLTPVIKYLLQNDVAAVLHFSWPYIKGLDNLINDINTFTQDERKRLNMFHFGKRFSIELKDDVFTDIITASYEPSLSLARGNHPAIDLLALEGNNWDSYYPSIDKQMSENILFITPFIGIIDFDDIDKSLREITEYDKRIENIEETLTSINLPKNLEYIFRFMPFIDSFVPPVFLKYLFKTDDGYKRLELPIIINEIKKIENEDINNLLDSLSAIIRDKSETFNVYNSYEKPLLNNLLCLHGILNLLNRHAP